METERASPARHVARELGIQLTSSVVADVDVAALHLVAEQLGRNVHRLSLRRMSWNDPDYWIPNHPPRLLSQYLAVGNAINFRFWSVRGRRLTRAGGVRAGQRLEGSMYMWRSLQIAVDRGTFPVLEASFLKSITEKEFDGLFADDSGMNPLSIAIDERIANLKDLGRRLEGDWNGCFWNVVRAAKGSLVAFARLAHNFRAFDDPLHKLTMVNAIMHEGSGLSHFDVPPLPAIDYELIKQLLRQGILRPRPVTASRLVQGSHLSHEEALELRRIGLYALIQLGELSGIRLDLLDNLYWGNRRECDDHAPVCLNAALADRCRFYQACKRLVAFMLPLEDTRYY